MASHGSQQMSSMVPSTSTLSMREKSHLKRRINRQHNCNFRAGYIEVNEEYLHKTGIRGRKRYLLYCVVAMLIIVALLNALVTAGLIYFLGITHLGIDSLEFLPAKGLLRVFGEAEVHKIKMFDSRIGGRYEQDLHVAGMEGPIVIQAPLENGTRVVMFDEKISITTDSFQVSSNINGEVFLSTSRKSTYPMKKSNNLHAESVQAKIVRSGSKYPDLVIESYNKMKIMGSEGVNINSQKGIVLAPEHAVILNTTSGSITLQAGQALYLNNQIPLVPTYQMDQSQNNISTQSNPSNQSDIYNSTGQPQPSRDINPSDQAYKLCSCLSSGRIFSIKVTQTGIGCNNVNANVC
ncbi:beta-sarcoglycan isoform X1 [Patella vulgata]|uniref:beta-sarcoglycan isoform X1 n=1 Tax=Patella vulgata TaxID=6465 RepID=UPI0021808DF2|nr:beta-sarcoglycan isoform X1 [Patella vulgata]